MDMVRVGQAGKRRNRQKIGVNRTMGEASTIDR